jgi:hypothetical protein
MSSLANKKVHLASHGSPGATAGDHRRRFIDVAPDDVLDEFAEVTEEQPGRIAVTRCLLGLEEVDERRHQPAPVVAETAPLVASGMIRDRSQRPIPSSPSAKPSPTFSGAAR